MPAASNACRVALERAVDVPAVTVVAVGDSAAEDVGEVLLEGAPFERGLTEVVNAKPATVELGGVVAEGDVSKHGIGLPEAHAAAHLCVAFLDDAVLDGGGCLDDVDSAAA